MTSTPPADRAAASRLVAAVAAAVETMPCLS